MRIKLRLNENSLLYGCDDKNTTPDDRWSYTMIRDSPPKGIKKGYHRQCAHLVLEIPNIYEYLMYDKSTTGQVINDQSANLD